MERIWRQDILVLGFDLREAYGANGGSLWTQERRSEFLLRPDVEQPLSVDPAVWPSVMEVQNEEYPLHLCGSINRILRASPILARGRKDSPVVIEVGVLTDAGFSPYWENTFDGWLRPEEDTTPAFTFQELGYDVADKYLVSGLSNCMLSPKELSDVRRNWAGRINSFGLFESADDATEYATACDLLIREHAPFFAYRIRRVEIKDVGHGLEHVTTTGTRSAPVLTKT